MADLWFWVIEVPILIVRAWCWLYRGLLLLVSLATFMATLVLLLAWWLGYPL